MNDLREPQDVSSRAPMVTLPAGLFQAKHVAAIGSALWLFGAMQTSRDGLVWGRAPTKIEALAARLGLSFDTIAHNFAQLADGGYVNRRHSGRGWAVTVRGSVLAPDVKQAAKEMESAVLPIAQTRRAAGDGSEEVTVVDARDSGAISRIPPTSCSAAGALNCGRVSARASTRNAVDRSGFSILKNRRGPRDTFWIRFGKKTLCISGGARRQ